MAGEVRGKVYEAITKVALEQAIKGNRKGWKVLWHEQPDWISIEADLAVGRDKDTVDALVMVTHSTSEGYSQKKFWRNTGELFQWKTQGPQPVRVMSVLFNASVKPGVADVEKQLLDGTLVVQDEAYGNELIAYVKSHQKKFGDSDQARASYAQRLCDPSDDVFDSEFAKVVAELAKSLKGMLKAQRIGLEQAWVQMKKMHDISVASPKERNTYVRNGIAKLMIGEPDLRSRIYDAIANGGELSDDPVPDYAVTQGLLSEGIASAEVDDTEVISAVEVLGGDTCERVIARAPERMQDFILPLRAADNINVYSQFVVDQFDDLTTQAGMKRYLTKCFDDPMSILPGGTALDVEPRDVWLFVYCMTLEKALQGKVVAYGLSNLATDTGYPEIGAGGFVIPPFVHRQKPLSKDMLQEIARVFSKKISSIGKAKLGSSSFKVAMKEMLIQRQRYVLSTYRNFDPLAWLIEEKLADAGVPVKRVTVPTFLKERAGVSSATSVFLKVGTDTLIYWQSVTEAGRIHKTKELSARFRATKLKWDGKSILQRKSANRIFLVVDGEWRKSDFEMFLKSGVDQVFYPDQLDDLVKVLKSGGASAGGLSSGAKEFRCAC